MGLIKNSVEQGQSGVENMVRAGFNKNAAVYDLIIVGAGPAGISASLTAKKYGLNFLTLDQDTLGVTVFFISSLQNRDDGADVPAHARQGKTVRHQQNRTHRFVDLGVGLIKTMTKQL